MIKLIKYNARVCLECQRMLNPQNVCHKEMTLQFEVFVLLAVGSHRKHGTFACEYLRMCLVLLGESGIGKQGLMRNRTWPHGNEKCGCVCMCVCPGLSVCI